MKIQDDDREVAADERLGTGERRDDRTGKARGGGVKSGPAGMMKARMGAVMPNGDPPALILWGMEEDTGRR